MTGKSAYFRYPESNAATALETGGRLNVNFFPENIEPHSCRPDRLALFLESYRTRIGEKFLQREDVDFQRLLDT